MMTTRRRPRLQLEVLERRETPSSFGVSALAARPTVQRFNGQGTANLTGQQAVLIGQQNTGFITGTSNIAGLQSFNGTITVVPNGRSATGTATLVGSNTGGTNPDSVEIKFNGPFRQRGSFFTGNTMTFTVINGTNRFLNARGNGRFSAALNTQTQSASFTFNGLIRPR